MKIVDLVNTNYTYRLFFSTFVLVFMLIWLINVSVGSASIPLKEVLKFLIGQKLENVTWQTILVDLRLPKSLTLIVVGVGLGISGLLMQTLFRNAMAGPSVLGVSSGAGLGVAFFVMAGNLFGFNFGERTLHQFSVVISALIGAVAVLFLIIFLGIKLKNNLSILIIGIMLSALTSSLVSVLSVFASAQNLQKFIFWGFGSVSNLSYTEIGVLYSIVFISLILIVRHFKSLNLMLLGAQTAQSMGVNIVRIKNLLLIVVGIVVGVLTAFVGPIAFIGLAVPHIARMIFKTSHHKVLIPAVVLLGAIIMLICDIISQISFNGQVIPINAVTSILGAPIVIYLILNQKNYQI